MKLICGGGAERNPVPMGDDVVLFAGHGRISFRPGLEWDEGVTFATQTLRWSIEGLTPRMAHGATPAVY